MHSDRGSQYCSYNYRNLIEHHKFKGSMSRKGHCYDNAPIERFWNVLKNELVYHHDYQTRMEAVSDIVKYIELEYNEDRLAKHCFAATQDKTRAMLEVVLGFKRV